jgi:hypothetical protein
MTRKEIEILSVEQMLRKDSGRYGVEGIILSVSSVEHVVASTILGCPDCMKKAKRSGKGDSNGSFVKVYDPPLFSIPYHLGLNKEKKCLSCEQTTFGPELQSEGSGKDPTPRRRETK